MTMNVEQRTQGRNLILTPQGSFVGVLAAGNFRALVHEALDRNQRLILVNLGELRDSTGNGSQALDDFGVETLLASAFMVRHAGGVLRICGASPEVKHVLESCGADKLLSTGETETLALDDMDELSPLQPFDILKFVREEEGSEHAGSPMLEAPEQPAGS